MKEIEITNPHVAQGVQAASEKLDGGSSVSEALSLILQPSLSLFDQLHAAILLVHFHSRGEEVRQWWNKNDFHCHHGGKI